MISDEIFRGRYHNSFEKPEPLRPGEVTAFTIDLHTADHVFKKGHRIMVQVQSTWFPLYDRNPQKFIPNIFEAKDSDYQKATQHIYRSKRYPVERRNYDSASERRERGKLISAGIFEIGGRHRSPLSG